MKRRNTSRNVASGFLNRLHLQVVYNFKVKLLQYTQMSFSNKFLEKKTKNIGIFDYDTRTANMTTSIKTPSTNCVKYGESFVSRSGLYKLYISYTNTLSNVNTQIICPS